MTELTYTANDTFALIRLKNNGYTFDELFTFHRNKDVTDWRYCARLTIGVPKINNIVGVADNLRQLKKEVQKWFNTL